MMTDSNNPLGVWTLVSMQFVFDDTGERVDVYGAHPDGVIVLTPEGHMIGIITTGAKAQRADPDTATLFRNMLAYSGPYRIEGDKFITNVDIAWHPSWVGTEQVRFFRVEGDRLFITTPPQTLPRYDARLGHAVLEWRRNPVTRR
jgi:hypothetical protein